MSERKIIEKPPYNIDDVIRAQLEFYKSVFRLGVSLVEDYRAGKCDRDKLMNAITKIFAVQPEIITRD